uniref:Uncharacterized protein n=1 Tax=Tetranychus urticae TaxID=32264 RepID=T1L1S4_TETUR
MNISIQVYFKNVSNDELGICFYPFSVSLENERQAVCVEAGMIALRRNAGLVIHKDFMDAILEVQAKKKTNLNYYA